MLTLGLWHPHDIYLSSKSFSFRALYISMTVFKKTGGEIDKQYYKSQPVRMEIRSERSVYSQGNIESLTAASNGSSMRSRPSPHLLSSLWEHL